MMTSERIALNNILQHKEYFDQKLIEIANHLDHQVADLSAENKKIKYRNQEFKKKNSDMKLKLKDLESQKYGYDKKYMELKKENDDLLEYLKKIQKEIDELKKENEQQRKEIKKQEKNINQQKTIIDKLKHMNSTNSNLPPSMDIMARTRAKAQANTREKTDRKRGGQNNHPLHKSNVSAKADHIIEIKVKKAPTGAVPVKNDSGDIAYYVTHEVDLSMKSVITETRYFIDTKGEELDQEIIKKYAINPLVYSADFKAAAVYLNQKGTIPLQRLCDMVSEISEESIQLRPSTISKWCQECHKKSEVKKEQILEEILSDPLVHVDETGFKVNGEQYWIHVITNEKGSYFLITKGRSDKEKGTIRYLELYKGFVIHDHWQSYQNLELCTHVECGAHIDRYMKSGRDFDESEECGEMLELMHEILRRKNELIADGIYSMPEEEMINYEKRYLEILERGLKKSQEKYKDTPSKYVPDFVNTFKRMYKDKDDYLMFMKEFIVPYTNNNAERQCRAVKAKKNISGQFVTEAGGQAYVSVLTLLQTAKLRNENALKALQNVFH